jgi:hypothetical protein
VDPFSTVSQGIGSDFEAFFAPLLAYVTLTQIAPDQGSVLTTVNNVPALKRSRRRQPFGVGGGELGDDTCRFVFRLTEATWVPKARDQIVDALAITWTVVSASLIAFNQLVEVDVEIKR